MVHGVLPEVGFSDDHCHFALSGWGLALLMGACDVACEAACGFAQVCKLKVYCLRLHGRRIGGGGGGRGGAWTGRTKNSWNRPSSRWTWTCLSYRPRGRL